MEPTPERPAAERASPATPLSNVSTRRWPLGQGTILVGLVLGIFAANLLLSLAVPSDFGWAGGPLNHYLVHLGLALSGLALILLPTYLVVGLAQGDVHAPVLVDAPFLLWLLAMVAGFAILLTFTEVRRWRRAVGAYLVAAQLTGFAAVHWSNLGA